MKTLEEILNTLSIVSEIAAAYPPAAAPALLAEKLLAIAQAAVTAHISATGQPLDLTKLHQIAPVK